MMRVITLALFLLVGLSGCTDVALTKLSEREANEALAFLYSQGVSASRAPLGDETYELRVRKKQAQYAITLLTGAGFPREGYASMGDVFERRGLLSSPMEERVRYQFAMSQELSRTISSIDGVVSARVHLVLPEARLYPTGGHSVSSASVLVRHLDDVDVGRLTASIKLLVNRSIDGLQYENITLIFVPVERWT